MWSGKWFWKFWEWSYSVKIWIALIVKIGIIFDKARNFVSIVEECEFDELYLLIIKLVETVNSVDKMNKTKINFILNQLDLHLSEISKSFFFDFELIWEENQEQNKTTLSVVWRKKNNKDELNGWRWSAFKFKTITNLLRNKSETFDYQI